MLQRVDKEFIYIGDDYYDVLLRLVNILRDPVLCLYPDKILSEPDKMDMHGNYNRHHSCTFKSMDSNNTLYLKIYISKGCSGESNIGDISIKMSYLSNIDDTIYYIYLSKLLHLSFKEKEEVK